MFYLLKYEYIWEDTNNKYIWDINFETTNISESKNNKIKKYKYISWLFKNMNINL